MALLLLDSFDHYADADKATKWTQYVTTGNYVNCKTTIAAVGARGTNGLKMYIENLGTSAGSLNIVPSSPAPSGDTAIVGFRFRCVSPFASLPQGTNSEYYTGGGSSNACMFAIRSGTVTQFWMRLNSNGTLSVYRGSTLLGTSAFALTQNVFHYIECKVKLHASAGTLDVKVDGFAILTLTAQNTNNAGTTAWDEFRLGPLTMYLEGGTPEWNFDDLYLADGSGSDGWADFRGDTRIDAVFPTTDGTTSGWTCSTGTDHYATVDEASANGDTDYNSTSTLNAKDTLNFPNLPVSGATIKGLQVVAQIRKTDAGAAGHKAVTRIAGTDYDGTEASVPSSYAFVRQTWGLKPSDSTAWTEANFNAAEFGYKKST